MHYSEDWSAFGVPFRCTVLLADTEATDNYFSERYFRGDQSAFLQCCDSSVHATQMKLDQLSESFTLGSFYSSSFFKQFGRTHFEQTEDQYVELLEEHYKAASL